MKPFLATGLIAAVGLAAACGGSPASAPASKPASQPISTTAPSSLSIADISALADAFGDQPLQGGQTAPFLAKWISASTFVFVQLDKPKPQEATAVTYLGVGQKGVFCAEAQPDRSGSPNSSFTLFHQWSAPDFARGLGGKSGNEGYWLSYLAVDQLSVAGRTVTPGIDYAASAAPAPSCGSNVPQVAFTAPGAGKLAADSIARLFGIFTDQPLQGGQVAPRIFKQLNDQTFAFLQYDKNTAKEATELRYFGIFRKGTYCKSAQPSPDFTHFHMLVASSYAQGHGGPANGPGFWGTWVAAIQFESQGRTVLPGVDRLFSPTPPPGTC
jgi:hypothetical protein